MTDYKNILDEHNTVKNNVIFLKMLGMYFDNYEKESMKGFDVLRDKVEQTGWDAFRKTILEKEPDLKAFYSNRINFPSCEFELNPRASFPESYYRENKISLNEGQTEGQLEAQKTDYKNRQSFGEVLLLTAWRRGLSPRIVQLSYHPSIVHIKFESINPFINALTIREPTLEALDLTIAANQTDEIGRFGNLKEVPVNTEEKNNGKGQKVDELIAELSSKFSRKSNTLKFFIHERIKSQFIRIKIKTYLLTEILDALKICAGIEWEWMDKNVIYLMPGNDFGRTYNLYSQSCIHVTNTNTEELKFTETREILDIFRQPIDELKFWWITQYFIYGGWPEIIKQFFYANGPILIFPGEELGARRIDPIPNIYIKDIKLGNLLIQTAWSRMFTLRPVYLDTSNIVAIRFIPRIKEIILMASGHPSIESLERCLIPIAGKPDDPNDNEFIINTINENNGRGRFLYLVLEEISRNFYFKYVKIIPNPTLESQYVKIDLRTRSLVVLLDTICDYLDSVWDWSATNTVYITRRLHSNNSIDYDDNC